MYAKRNVDTQKRRTIQNVLLSQKQYTTVKILHTSKSPAFTQVKVLKYYQQNVLKTNTNA